MERRLWRPEDTRSRCGVDRCFAEGQQFGLQRRKDIYEAVVLAGVVAKVRRLLVFLFVIAAKNERLAGIFVSLVSCRRCLRIADVKLIRADNRVRAPLGQQNKQKTRGQNCPHTPLLSYDPQNWHR
jgi:hypothetical protein